MNLQPENKIALATGSTAGIGFAIAKALAIEGASVIINGRTEARVAEAIASIRADLARSKNATVAEMEREFFHTARPGSLLQRFATTEEIAALVAFVSSPLSAATNGAALRVEDGVVRSIL
jgi:NAD(P)-dependent dehydrogenase (short-subunit alcohol dehydrogenase family)